MIGGVAGPLAAPFVHLLAWGLNQAGYAGHRD